MKKAKVKPESVQVRNRILPFALMEIARLIVFGISTLAGLT